MVEERPAGLGVRDGDAAQTAWTADNIHAAMIGQSAARRLRPARRFAFSGRMR